MTTLAAIAHGGYDPEHVHGAMLTTDRGARRSPNDLAALPLAERRGCRASIPIALPSIVAGALIACMRAESAAAG